MVAPVSASANMQQGTGPENLVTGVEVGVTARDLTPTAIRFSLTFLGAEVLTFCRSLFHLGLVDHRHWTVSADLFFSCLLSLLRSLVSAAATRSM